MLHTLKRLVGSLRVHVLAAQLVFLATVVGVSAQVAVLVTNGPLLVPVFDLFFLTPDLLHARVDPTRVLVAGGIALGFGAIALVVVLVRAALAVLRRVVLDKSDVYFALALLISTGSVLIGHFWK
jgi:hypothetical protein